jgi:hypothetical protein
MTRPAPWKLSEIPTLWLDVETGAGVDDAGTPILPILGGRRKKPALVDLLTTAAHHRATRIMLSGTFPTVSATKTHWLLVPTEGWSAAGHYIKDDRPPTGRFVSAATGHKVEVRVAREWFGTDGIAPASAREAMQLLSQVLAKALPGHLAASPTATGQNIWAYSLPKDLHPPLLEPDLAELIHRTSGQHRTEHLVEGRSRCDCGDCLPLISAKTEIPGFCYVDGRFMYSALCREVGIGGRRLTKLEAQDRAEADSYARARYLIRFTVPQGWDTLGLFGVFRHDAGQWHYPNRPGATHDTWVDAVELRTARNVWGAGSVEILEGIAFERGRPLDNFAARIMKARENAAELDADAHLVEAVESALRAILLQTIGGFHSEGRDRTMVVESTFDVPPQHQGTIRTYGDVVTYLIPAQLNERLQLFHHPEYSSQIWARERARILIGPTAPYRLGKTELKEWGALEVDPTQLIGVNGDALYLAAVPQACLPVDQGGGDDGKTGRLRVKGWIGEPMPVPATTEARNNLRGRAEAYGFTPTATV